MKLNVFSLLVIGLVGSSAFADSATYRCGGVNAMDGTSLAGGGAYVVTVDDGNQTASVSQYTMGADHTMVLQPAGDLRSGPHTPTDSRYVSDAFAFTRAGASGNDFALSNTGALTVYVNSKAFQVLLCPRETTPNDGLVLLDANDEEQDGDQTDAEFILKGGAAQSLYKLLQKNFSEDHCAIGTSHFVTGDGMSCIKSGGTIPDYECRSIMDLKTGKISGDEPMCLQ